MDIGKTLPPSWYEVWAERSAIMEYDGGLPREEAERRAYLEVLAAIRKVPSRG